MCVRACVYVCACAHSAVLFITRRGQLCHYPRLMIKLKQDPPGLQSTLTRSISQTVEMRADKEVKIGP